MSMRKDKNQLSIAQVLKGKKLSALPGLPLQ